MGFFSFERSSYFVGKNKITYSLQSKHILILKQINMLTKKFKFHSPFILILFLRIYNLLAPCSCTFFLYLFLLNFVHKLTSIFSSIKLTFYIIQEFTLLIYTISYIFFQIIFSDPELNLLSLISDDHTILSWVLGDPFPFIPTSEVILIRGYKQTSTWFLS